jgi:DNA-directed RNA polymerase specialized sigma24 family protein
MASRPAGATGATATLGEKDGDADAVLFARLAADGFAGPAYDYVCDRLARYGYQVLQAWIRRGDIFARCAEKKIKGLPLSAGWDEWVDDEIDDLVQETVIHALLKFRRDALAGRGWRPDGGATLTSYFTVTCLAAFSAVYKSHRNARRRRAESVAAARRSRPVQVPDVAEEVTEQAAADERLSAIADPTLRLVVRLNAEGYSHSEISNVLPDGTTARAVEGMLYRYRKQTRRH